MEKADVTENGVNSNKLIFYKAAVPQRNVENRGEVCYSIWYVYKSKTSISSRFPSSQRQAEKGENGGEEMKLIGTS